jgi:hypothetical protein
MVWGSDVDGLLSNFGQGFIERGVAMGVNCCLPEDHTKIDKWMFPCSPHFKEIWASVEKDEAFWLGLPVYEQAREAMQEIEPPAFYITSRPVRNEVTEQWLEQNGFPKARVITVSDPQHKLQYLVEHKLDGYVDDLVSTIRQVRSEGVNGILYKAPYQVSEDISGLPIISDLRELPKMLESVNGV